MRYFYRQSTAALVLLASLQIAAAADKPPSVAQIKQCIQQVDSTGKRRFLWKEVTLGEPRLPRDAYESIDMWGWQNPRKSEGYPVHVVFNFDGLVDIDKEYWLIKNDAGKWQILLVCTIP